MRCLGIALWLPGLLVAAETAPPRFESDILPLLKAKCLACHSGQTRQANLSLASRDDILKGGKTGAAAIPGKPNDSLMLAMVSSGTMPVGGKKLTPEEILLVRRWIESGALRDGEQSAVKKVAEREIFSTILGAKCYVCHGRRTQEAGLDLRSRESILKGGRSGPAMRPGKPDESLIVKRIAAQQMPPAHLQEQFSVRGLTDDEFAKLKQWIAEGAPPDNETPLSVAAETDPLVKAADRQFWSFRPPLRPEPPQVKDASRVANPIDAFLLHKLQAKGLTYSTEAPRLVQMRRAYLDLIGLPPSPEEVQAYLADHSPDAYRSMIDRLLESPHYGERWAKYWLDAAGYADSEGGVSNDNPRPHAWRYRDYVIRALNADKPYDRFLVEQIAGDELFDYKAQKVYTPEQRDLLVATAFLRMAPDPTYSTEQNFIPERFDTLAATLEVFSSSVMGLTVGCARCHDHKYDPLPQRDYYRLSANFQPAYDPYDWRVPTKDCVGVGAKCTDDDARDLPARSPDEENAVEEHNRPFRKRIEELEQALEKKAEPLREKLRAERMEKLPEGVRKDLRLALDLPTANRNEIQRYLLSKFASVVEVPASEIDKNFDDFRKEAEPMRKSIAEARSKLKPKPMIRAMFDMGGEPTPNRMLLRGDFTNPGPLVEPGVPSVLSGGEIAPYRLEKPPHSTGTSGRRLALARWLTQPNHPLTARVMVNRIWQYHFGAGLVASGGNFGKVGSAPTHPELLDWLATEFVRQGWSIKTMHRLMMNSNAYRQSSTVDATRGSADPDNRLLSRFPLRRLDAEALRDSILKVSQRLDAEAFGPPAVLKVAKDGEVADVVSSEGHRRSIYLQLRRSTPVTLLESFDAPQLSPNCLRRRESTVSSQALQLMNSDLVREAAGYMAGRVTDAAGPDPEKQVQRIYLAALTRQPDASELKSALASLEQLKAGWKRSLEKAKPAEPIERKAEWLALVSFCHTVLNSAEFLYVD